MPGPHISKVFFSGIGKRQVIQLSGCMSRNQKSGQDQAQAMTTNVITASQFVRTFGVYVFIVYPWIACFNFRAQACLTVVPKVTKTIDTRSLAIGLAPGSATS